MTVIDDKYEALLRAGLKLGAPTGDESPGAGGGSFRHYASGSIFAFKKAVFEVHGAIRELYGSLGWERSVLGYPTSDERVAPDGHGHYNHFQHGSIYWTPETGAHEVHGSIRDRWAALGWERSALGYPRTSETRTPDGRGWYNHFQHGSIYWTPETGAHEVPGAIRDHWVAFGGERGPLGYPVTAQTQGLAEDGPYSEFEGGIVFASGQVNWPPPGAESNWWWCQRCEGLYWGRRGESLGTCLGGARHATDGMHEFALMRFGDSAEGRQSGWTRCRKCWLLFHLPSGGGVCAAGGEHDHRNSPAYTVEFGASLQQWRYCSLCHAMFWVRGDQYQLAHGALARILGVGVAQTPQAVPPKHPAVQVDGSDGVKPSNSVSGRPTALDQALTEAAPSFRVKPAEGGLISVLQHRPEVLIAHGQGTAAVSGHCPAATEHDGTQSGQYRLRLAWDANWSFDAGLLGWRTEGGQAFADQPVPNVPIPAPQAWPNLVPLGGDYWHGPISIGAKGRFMLRTRDDQTGRLYSERDFRIFNPYMSFLIGGGHDDARLRVELQLRFSNDEERGRALQGATYPTDGDYVVVRSATGHGNDLLRREVWDVTPYVGISARVCIRDEATNGHICVNNFRFSEEDPRPQLLEVRPGFYRDPDAPVWGAADLHTHPVAHLAHGKQLLAGEPDGGSTRKPINEVLGWCTAKHGPDGNGTGSSGSPHLFGMEGAHRVGGYPEFDGWPRFRSQAHQQMYVDWLQRAYEGGVRLIVALAVHNRMLNRMARRDVASPTQDDVDAVEEQIQAIKDFVARHDFMRIAYTSADARRIVHDGRLCVVLGVEVDTLGNFAHESTTTREEVSAYLRHMHERLGIRHVFPIHMADNAFGKFAVGDNEAVVSRNATGNWPQVRDASSTGVEFRLGDTLSPGLQAILPLYVGVYPWYAETPGGHANAGGLTNLGEFAIREFMRHGFLIDVDHMSEYSLNRTLDLAERQDLDASIRAEYKYPLMSGHSSFRELAWSRAANETSMLEKCGREMNLTKEQVERIGNLGGMLGLGMYQGDGKSYGGRVDNNCASSTKSWAQSYCYALDQMGSNRSIGIGSDVNSFLNIVAPRFGWNAAYGLAHTDDLVRNHALRNQVTFQQNGVRYNEPNKDFRGHRFEGVLEGKPGASEFDGEGREICQAIAIYKRWLHTRDPRLDPRNGSVVDVQGSGVGGKVENFVRGFIAESDGELLRPNEPWTGNSPWEQRAAFLVRHGQTPGSGDRDPGRVHELYAKVLFHWQRWTAMEGSNVPLQRHRASEQRDYDFNLDGLAHYGLLPDFFQDLKNIGLNYDDLAPLFSSAEAYIRVWEKCEARKGSIPR